MYDEKGSIDTFTLKRDSEGEFQLYDNNKEEMSVNWNFGTVFDNNFIFEIVEEKLTDDLKNALTVLGKYCKGRDCDKCVFNKKDRISFYCGLKISNPFINYNKYVGGGEDE